MSHFTLDVYCGRCCLPLEGVLQTGPPSLYVKVCNCVTVKAPPPSGIETLAILLAKQECGDELAWDIQSAGWKKEFLDRAGAYAGMLWPELGT